MLTLSRCDCSESPGGRKLHSKSGGLWPEPRAKQLGDYDGRPRDLPVDGARSPRQPAVFGEGGR
eukprot:scaffold19446_cov22-Prasinocladus_malaysianus.AAC.2